jgi:hypothetical protein
MRVHTSSVLQQACARSNMKAYVTSGVTGVYKWLVDAFRAPTAPTHARGMDALTDNRKDCGDEPKTALPRQRLGWDFLCLGRTNLARR